MTMTIEQSDKVKMLIKEFSVDPDIISFVNKTESGFKTTQGNYGPYMAFLTPYQSKASALYIISEALKVAGADVQGVNSALRILVG